MNWLLLTLAVGVNAVVWGALVYSTNWVVLGARDAGFGSNLLSTVTNTRNR